MAVDEDVISVTLGGCGSPVVLLHGWAETSPRRRVAVNPNRNGHHAPRARIDVECIRRRCCKCRADREAVLQAGRRKESSSV
jgi:hypothetical protein